MPSSRFSSLSAVVIVLATLSACTSGASDTSPPPPPPAPTVASIDVTPGADTLTALGQTRQLTAVARDAAGAVISGKTFTWQTSASAVVTIDSASGLALAKGNGTATLSAVVDGKSGQALLLVDQQVASVTVSPTNPVIAAVGVTQQFAAIAKDANGNAVAGVTFLWVSSDPSVAVIDQTGKATARGAGLTAVTAAGRGIPGSAVVTVSSQTATQLAVTVQPPNPTEGVGFASTVRVEIRDVTGALVTTATDAVTLAIGTNAGGGTLSGTTTVNAIGGVATFGGLAIDRAGVGYTLVASSGALTAAPTSTFNVFLNFAQVSIGFNHSCGVTVSRALYCWGTNTLGQIGDGTTTTRNAPVRVLSPAGVAFTGAFAGQGAMTSCALAVGQVSYCWGLGNGGETGNGAGAGGNRLVPDLVLMPAGVNFAALSAAGEHNCGLTASGAAYCWGQNGTHQIGDGTTSVRIIPTLVASPAGVTFVAISAGSGSTCGLTGVGTVYCWGANGSGQVGDGTLVERTIPTLAPAPGSVTYTAVSDNGGATCALATTGAVYCWGDNTFGQLGNGTLVNHSTAALVTMPGGVTFTAISLGSGNGCALSTTGVVYCWGTNNAGQIGDGTFTARLTPTPITVPSGAIFASIAAGNQSACAVTTTGAVYCWGLGFIGDGTNNTSHPLPTRVAR